MAKMVFEILNCFYLRKYSYLESIMNAWNGSFFNLMISHIHNQSQSTLNSSSTCDVHCFSLRYVFDHLKKLPKSEIICCKIVFFVCTLLNGDSLYIVGLVLNVQQGPDEVGKIMNRSAQFLSSPANSQYWSKSSQESDPACHNMEYSSSVFLELFKTFSRKPYFSTNWPSSSSFFASLYFCILSLLINKSYFGSLKLKSLIKGNNSFYI